MTKNEINWRLRFWMTFSLIALLASYTIHFCDSDKPVRSRAAGAESVVFDWSEDACEPAEIPDAPARVFRDGRGLVQLIAFNHSSHPMIGASQGLGSRPGQWTTGFYCSLSEDLIH